MIIAPAAKVNIIAGATIIGGKTMSDPFRLSAFLPYRLAVLSARISRRLSAEYGRSHGLSVAEWRVMVHLQRCGEVSVREIHNCVNLEKSRVSRAVSRLAAAGLVRKAAARTDARLVSISLSAAGEAALTEILPAAIEVERRLLAAIPTADLAVFSRVIEAIHATLDTDPEARPRSPMDRTADD